FCEHCREDFTTVVGQTACPRCGADLMLSLLNPISETATLVDFDPVAHARFAANNPAAPVDPDLKSRSDDQDPLVGAVLDVYKIGSLIGRGGMGAVYLAWHQDLHRRCALKILAPQRVARDRDYITRFRNEGRAAAALVHPNIVTVHAIGETGDLHH